MHAIEQDKPSVNLNENISPSTPSAATDNNWPVETFKIEPVDTRNTRRSAALTILLGIAGGTLAASKTFEWLGKDPLKALESEYNNFLSAVPRFINSEHFKKLQDPQQYSTALHKEVYSDMKLLRPIILAYVDAVDAYIKQRLKPNVYKEFFSLDSSAEQLKTTPVISVFEDEETDPDKLMRSKLKIIGLTLSSITPDFSETNAVLCKLQSNEADYAIKDFLSVSKRILGGFDFI